ncbi:MAG: O-antigen ligase family protein [Chloroflexota bacterium]
MSFIFLAFYLVFLGGSAYYTLIFPVRLLHHLLMTVLVCLWYGKKLRGDGIPRTPLDAPLAAAVLIWVITAAFSVDARMAFENLWFVFLHLTGFLVLVDLFQRGRSRLVMETTFMLGALVVIVTGLELTSWYFGLGIIPGTDVGWFSTTVIPLELPRVSLALNISTLLAGFVAPLLPLTLAWGLTARRKDYRQVLLTLFMALALVLLLTFSRGGWLSAVAGLGTLGLFYLVETRKRSAEQRRLNSSPVFAAAGVVVVGIVAVVIFTVSQGRTSGDRVRLDMYESAVEITADYPLTGVGPGIYGRALRSYRSPGLARDRLASAHNAPLNTAAETGLPGIVVSAWLALALALTATRTWARQDHPARKLRAAAAIAGLVGVGVHSMVDVFTITPVVLIITLLAAYAITGHRHVLAPRPAGRRWPAAAGLVVALGYGVFLLQADRAQLAYGASFAADDAAAISRAQHAARIDPALTLYDLQIAHKLGIAAGDDPAAIASAITAYEHALLLEPTWDTGWANLGALHARLGDFETAAAHLEQAARINPLTIYSVHAARFYELSGTGDPARVVSLYFNGMQQLPQENTLPLADFWIETPARRETLDRYVTSPGIPLSWRYRTLAAHDPTRVESLVPDAPQSAEEYWVAAQHALTIAGDTARALALFNSAISADPDNGDYYASRARARLAAGQPVAEISRDLDIAAMLGTRFEQPAATRAQLAETPEARRAALADAVPPRVVRQEFAAVLYGGRAAQFDLLPDVRSPGPGRAVLTPWYTLAADYLADNDVEAALRVYRAILDRAPFEEEAAANLAALSGG